MPAEITAEHLRKLAIIYVRQSSSHQVQQHIQSQKRQYNLVTFAEAKGWPRQRIVVIDEDLGKSATGTAQRDGFDRALNLICTDQVGALFFGEASRLSRNGREWQQIIEFSGIVGALIVDYDGAYDPRLPSDQLFLGMKSTVSQFEGALFQQRAKEGIRLKAASGQLWNRVSAAFEITEDNRCQINPDLRIQQVIRLVLSKLPELGSISQVHKWLHREGIEVPIRTRKRPCRIVWRLPDYDTIRRILTDPLCAGAYVYPRTKTFTQIVDGRPIKTRGHLVPLDEVEFVFKNHFPGYITWDEFERNQRIIANNAAIRGPMVRGAAKKGSALLCGILFCQHCSRKLRVNYYGDQTLPKYSCEGDRDSGERKRCLSFSGRIIEQVVVKELLSVLQPHAVEAASLAEEKYQQASQQKHQAIANALEQARYEAKRVQRQLDAVEPEKGLVFRELTARWEDALCKVAELERQYNQTVTDHQPISQDEYKQFLRLADKLSQIWEHSATSNETKKQLIRTLIESIWVQACEETKLKMTIRWKGGVHTEYFLSRSHRGRPKTSGKQQTVTLIKQLASVADDIHIARILNRIKHPTQKGQTWSQPEVKQFREANNIAPFSREEYERRGWVNLTEAAKELGINPMTVVKLIKQKIIVAEQVVAYAPWCIERSELNKPEVRQIAQRTKQGNKVPFYHNPNQLNLK